MSNLRKGGYRMYKTWRHTCLLWLWQVAQTVRTLRVTGRGGGGILGNASPTTTNPTERARSSRSPASPPCRGTLTNAYQPYRSSRPSPGKPTLPKPPLQANHQPTRSSKRHAYQPSPLPAPADIHTFFFNLLLTKMPNLHQHVSFHAINRLSSDQKHHAY